MWVPHGHARHALGAEIVLGQSAAICCQAVPQDDLLLPGVHLLQNASLQPLRSSAAAQKQAQGKVGNKPGGLAHCVVCTERP